MADDSQLIGLDLSQDAETVRGKYPPRIKSIRLCSGNSVIKYLELLERLYKLKG